MINELYKLGAELSAFQEKILEFVDEEGDIPEGFLGELDEYVTKQENLEDTLTSLALNIANLDLRAGAVDGYIEALQKELKRVTAKKKGWYVPRSSTKRL